MRANLLAVPVLAALAASPVFAQAPPKGCDPDNGGITLSPGFCAGVFADNLGHARHMAVAPDGTVFVNTWSGRFFGNDKVPAGGYIVALRDTKGTGRADSIQRFGEPSESGAAGGTGIAVYNNFVYVEEKDRILRYALQAGLPSGAPQVVLSEMPIVGGHNMRAFIIDPKGNLFLTVGSATNSCQQQDRQSKSPGVSPCVELETRGGIWKYDANTLDQKFSPKERYAVGVRNGEAFAFDGAGRLYVAQHGRDQLSQNWPDKFTNEQSAELPAEEVFHLEAGGDYGWPYCYYDPAQRKKVLAPEYGGDGKAVGQCAEKKGNVASFPAHWAPNAMLINQGTQFPAPYRGGMFIAFHGSWNRAPLPQQGFNVVYQPFKDGAAAGDYVVFADGFTGGVMDRATAAHRPTGLAMAQDGTMYISDDKGGRIWRVQYVGDAATARIAAAAKPNATAATAPTRLDVAKLPLPRGVTRARLVLGEKIFQGDAKEGTCAGCHGMNGEGTAGGSSLIAGAWLWSDGSVAGITRTITNGVAEPKQTTGVMPPAGGTQISKSDIAAVAAYVWAIGHANDPKAKR